MTDKEKQIEEMGKILCNDMGCKYCERCYDLMKAESLYNAGCRKIPEGSVVLTKEEYEELKFAKNLLELREETIKSLEDANIRYAEALELKVNKKERKETAREILQMFKDYLKYSWTKSVDFVYHEIEKQFGVEVEE